MVMVAYAVANIISPQIWRAKDGPRYIPAWIVQIVLSFSIAPSLALIIWFILNKRNKQRKLTLQEEGEKKGFVSDGSDGEIEVDIAVLDLTDLENTNFIYPL